MGDYEELRNSVHRLREQMQPYVLRTERLTVELEYMKTELAEQTIMLKTIDTKVTTLNESKAYSKGAIAVWAFLATLAGALLSGGLWEIIRNSHH